jgi:hypothetical protein
MREKRGQAEIAALVIGIAILSVLYLLLTPLAEKCKILPDMPECKAAVAQKEALFDVKPGFLEAQLEHATYSLNSVELFTKREVSISTMLENVRIENSIFNNRPQYGFFRVYGKGEEIKLFIYISNSRGSLKVKINDRQVAIIQGSGINVVNVPVQGLLGVNSLVLESSAPLIPWQKNFCDIDKVDIKEVYSLFKISQTETVNVNEDLSKLDSAKLTLISECLTSENLRISLNNANVYDDKACGLTSFKVSIAKNNTFVFSSKGDYYIHDATLDLKFKVKDYPIYYFELDSAKFDSLRAGTAMAMLKLQFDSTQSKKFDLYVNGYLVTKAETNRVDWQTNLRQWMRVGQNSIRIMPKTSMNILDMTVEVG